VRADLAASRPKHAPGFSTGHRHGVHTIEDGTGASLCTLNATALAVWDLCDGCTSPQEMVDAMGSVFDAPVTVLDRDVEVALDLLSRLGLLEGIEGS
jgi:hypothetical protein